MKPLLICPDPRPGFEPLAAVQPLAIAPLLGGNLLEYWLSALACSGHKEAGVLVHDRPESIASAISKGERWGMQVELIRTDNEITPTAALAEYGGGAPQGEVFTLEHLPGCPERPLFGSYREFMMALLAWLPRALTPDRVGIHEIEPGVWVGRHSRISREARLSSPCWVGQNVHIGAGAVLGQNTIIEDGAFIEAGATVAESYVGVDTFVGGVTEVGKSLVWGRTLVNWETNSQVLVPDPFLLAPLRASGENAARAAWLRRLVDRWSGHSRDLSLAWKTPWLRKEGVP